MIEDKKGEEMRKTIKHTVYTLEEKEKILELYMSGQKSAEQLVLEYDLCNHKRIGEWRDMKLKYGRIVDRRGLKLEGQKPRGRPKSVKIEEMSKEALIEELRMIEDIKKSIAYLRRKEKRIKSLNV